jgi:hypothetical protein
MPRASRSRGSWIRRVVAVGAIGGLMIGFSSVAIASNAVAARPAVSSYGFNQPSAIKAVNGDLWIANLAGNSVTETTTAGAWVRTLSASSYGFNKPDALAVSGHFLFVVNQQGSVTELNASNGSLVRIVKGVSYQFSQPTAAIVDGGNVWVLNSAGNSVTEFTVATGALVRVLTNPSGSLRFDDPVALTSIPGDIWIVNRAGGSTIDHNAGSLTEIDPTTGAFVRQVAAASLGLEGSAGIAFDGTHLWISDSQTNAVTETTSVGGLVQVVTNGSHNANYGFDGPSVVRSAGGHVYVISPLSSSPMVTQIDPTTANGDWFECNTNSPTPGWLNPTSLAVTGGHVWVVGAAVGGGSVLVELGATPYTSAGGQVIARFS